MLKFSRFTIGKMEITHYYESLEEICDRLPSGKIISLSTIYNIRLVDTD
jgi:hypothetical protein